MVPPVPTECDACAKPLDKPLVCSKCKAYAYCDETCQAAHWGRHKTGCSAWPEGDLTPAKIEFSQGRADEANKVLTLLDGLMADVSGLNVPIGSEAINQATYGIIDQAARGQSQAYKKLLDYRLPAQFATPPLPNSPTTPTGEPTPELLFRHFARLFLLNELSLLSPAQAQAAFAPAAGAGRGALAAMFAQMAAQNPAAGHCARLEPVKVLAVPDRLSMDEYAAVVRHMPFGLMVAVPEDRGRPLKWATLMGAAGVVRHVEDSWPV